MTAMEPEVYCPFPAELSPHVDTARTHLDAWVSRHGLIHRELPRRRFADADFARFAAMTYPELTEPDLCLVADWFAWLFLLDDQLDDGAVGRDPRQAGSVMADLYAVLTSDGDSFEQWRQASPIVASLADLWHRTMPRASADWRSRFVTHVAAGAIAACWEADNRAAGTVPDEQSYVENRRHTGAIYVCMDLIEVVRDIELPAEVIDGEVFAGTLRAACDVVCWTNDVYSLDKESALGEFHNLVSVVAHHERLDRPAAVAAVLRRIADATDEFLAGEQRLLGPEFAAHHAGLARYLAGMRSWMRGNLDWSRETKRYRAEQDLWQEPARYLESVTAAAGSGARPQDER
ncbi:hypothetical protein QQG74_15830 [Micromonospora sp. FIMYZ51]|uniref:terpene synthase family protein n=1 Tax=Micromonospora sp. FIMYZ51 TaxID=3051832 RepID=UPI00311F0990